MDDIQWFFRGRSEELIAILGNGTFVPLPAFATRLQLIDNAGIILNGVTVGDSGVYTVEINGFDKTGDHFVLRRHVIVQVSSRCRGPRRWMLVVRFTVSGRKVVDTEVILKCFLISFL